MNMRKAIISFLTCLCSLTACPQNTFNVKTEIARSLSSFFGVLSDINDPVEPANISYLASEFRGGNYFRLNGKEADFEEFLQSYAKNDLGKRPVNHTLAVSKDNITKTSSDAADHRWTVKARLERSSTSEEDVCIRDENVTVTVKWNGADKEVSILDLNFSTPLKIIHPVVKTEYLFEIDRYKSTLSVSRKGGRWKVAVKSLSREARTYPEMERFNTYGDWNQAPYKFTASYPLRDAVQEKSNDLTGYLRNKNHSFHKKKYSVKLIQTGSGKVLYQDITQNKNSITEYSFDEYSQLSVFYSPKYNFGLSYMNMIDYSRFGIGFLCALNFDFFKSMKYDYEKQTEYKNMSDSEPRVVSSKDGYTITAQTVYPQRDNYSELMDPDNKAKHYHSRCLFMLQGGFNVTEWLRLDLGVGGASSHVSHYLKDARSVTIYRYEKTKTHLPDVEETFEYQYLKKDYYFLGETKWRLAVRPALMLNIPLGTYDTSLSVGVGYTFVKGMKDGNSIDFSLGIRWEV